MFLGSASRVTFSRYCGPGLSGRRRGRALEELGGDLSRVTEARVLAGMARERRQKLEIREEYIVLWKK